MTGHLLFLSVTFSVFGDCVCGFQRGDIRLVGGNNEAEGRVEIFLNGEWGTIDDDPWDDNDARVVCRQLGYTLGGVAYREAHFGEGSGPIWLDSIECTGRENNLLSCFYETDTSEDSHREDVGVFCYEKEIRLVNGNGRNEGRVEILKNGDWGTVDEDPWTDTEAAVVCRQLGYLHGGVGFKGGRFGPGTGPIWLDDVNCIGNEPSLTSCSHGTVTTEDSHDEDVGVRCAWKVRLANGSIPSEGRVEVHINNTWGTIRDNDWDNREANVVCAQLGYPLGGIAYSGAYFGEGNGPILLENFRCGGTESSLFHCSHRVSSTVSPQGGGHSKNAGVACFDLVLDPCKTNPCGPSGLCIREGFHYRCICPDGTGGRRCEIDSDPCKSSHCNSSDQCVQRLNNRYCTCLSTSNDTILCQYEVNPCQSNPCTDNETCVPRGDRFDCVIKGDVEPISSDPCYSAPCLNNGLCIPYQNDYRCICPHGAEGSRCERDADACFSNPCKENEVCLVQEKSYRCIVAGKRVSTNPELITSYIALILAICALVVAVVCLIKITKMQKTETQQGDSPVTEVNEGHGFQMNFQQIPDKKEEGCSIGYKQL